MNKIIATTLLSSMTLLAQGPIIHDAEYSILEAQNGKQWKEDDKKLDAKLAEVRKKNGGKAPNIIYILLDDVGFGEIGMDNLSVIRGYKTPNMSALAKEGMSLNRMYTEPSCTPTRAAVLTGRLPVRHGMGVVGMPHEFSGLRAEEITIAEVLSEAGYSTAFYGKGHLGDIEESYLHNQGFDEALFTPMNQITSLYSPEGNAVNAVLGLHPAETATGNAARNITQTAKPENSRGPLDHRS